MFIISALLTFFLPLAFVDSVIISLAITSIPFWFFFVFGNFGGYFINDIELFSTWYARIKSFAAAITITVFLSFSVFLKLYFN